MIHRRSKMFLKRDEFHGMKRGKPFSLASTPKKWNGIVLLATLCVAYELMIGTNLLLFRFSPPDIVSGQPAIPTATTTGRHLENTQKPTKKTCDDQQQQQLQDDKFNFMPVLGQVHVSKLSKDEQHLRVLCYVNTHEGNHLTKAKAIAETWGGRCDDLVFVSNATDKSIGAVALPNIKDSSYENLWQKVRETLRYIWTHYGNDYEWFFKADDDTYAIIENLKAFLASPEIRQQHEEGVPLHIGNPVAMWIDESGKLWDNGRQVDATLLKNFLKKMNGRFLFNVGGAGWVMNKAFMKNIVDWIDREECAPTRNLSTLLDDPMLSFCSANFGVMPYNGTRDENGRERFHQESPRVLYTMTPKDNLYKAFKGGKRLTGGIQVGDECCSSQSVTFHHMNASEMYAADDMLYACRPKQIMQTDKTKALRVALNWPPFSTVQRIAGDSKKVVVLLVNCGYLDMVDNLVGSILRFNVTNFVLVPLDQSSYRILLESYPDNVIPPNPELPLADAKPVGYKTAGFAALNSARPLILLRFAEAGFTFLYTDVDMYWKSNVLQVMEEQIGKSEALLFKDNGPNWDTICSCMLYMKPTPNNRKLLVEWNRCLRTVDPDDQAAWNAAVKKLSSRVSIRFLGAPDNFPSGTEYFDHGLPDEQSKAHIVHNNWIAGSQNKTDRFKNHSLWQPTGLLEQVSYTCGSEGSVSRSSKIALAPQIIGGISLALLPPESQRNTPQGSGLHQNRTLVVLLGNIRGGEPTWQSLYHNLLDPNQADLALMIGHENKWESSLYMRAKYVWNFPEYKDWSAAIDDLFGTNASDEHSWRRIALANKMDSSPFSGTKEDPQGGGVINHLARWWLKNRLEKQGLLKKYDRFVITRTDQYYSCGLDLAALDTSKIWVPTGEDWLGGICDRFVVCNKHDVLKILDILEPAIRHPQAYYGFRGNTEAFVKLRWTEEGLFDRVRRFRRSMFTASLRRDAMRWYGNLRKVAFIEDGEEILFKYEDEYYQAISCSDFAHA